MGKKKVEINSNTSLNKVKTTLYNMIRSSKKIDGRSFQKYVNQVAAIKNKEENRQKLMHLYDTIVAIDKGESKSSFRKVAEVKETKNKAATKISQAFKKHVEPVVEFKNLSKAKSHIEFNVDHVPSYGNLDFRALYIKLRDRIYSEARKLMTIKSNIKLAMGVNVSFMDKDKQVFTQTVETKVRTVYSKDELQQVLLELANDINKLFEAMRHAGSGFALTKIHYIFLESYDIKPVRGSSYIPTPEKYSNPKCGLINIKNEDQECFKWCMRYHQSKKAKNDDRTTVLKKLDDKYIYDGVTFPAGYDDIKKFENNNEVAVFVYNIGNNNNINREYVGNPCYICNDVIYLLRIENEEKSHYVYIKHLSRLMNFNHYSSMLMVHGVHIVRNTKMRR
jgi:hypothetical protein